MLDEKILLLLRSLGVTLAFSLCFAAVVFFCLNQMPSARGLYRNKKILISGAVVLFVGVGLVFLSSMFLYVGP